MEQLGSITAVAFDKTGTLTQGAPQLTDVKHPTKRATTPTPSLVGPRQPNTRANTRWLGDRGRRRRTRPAVASGPGFRLCARTRCPCHHRRSSRRSGQPSAFTNRRSYLGPDDAAVADLEAAGKTVVIVVADGVPFGILALADQLRAGAGDTVAELTTLTGTAPVLLTGDNPRAATTLAAQLGITDIRAGLLPQDKVTAVREIEAEGRRVLLVGDGVNDAPALAAAHTSVAMGRAGSDLALETADAVIVRDDLATLPAVIALSRRARRIVIANLAIATTFITGLVLWDLRGHLPLPLGVAGHEGSTVIVGLNGMRLLARRTWITTASPSRR